MSSNLFELLQRQIEKLGGIPFVLTNREWVVIELVGSAAATAANFDVMKPVPFDGFLEEVIVNYNSVGGAAATVQLEKCTSATTNGNGVALFTAPQSLTATARTRYTASLVDNAAAKTFNKGDMLSIIDAGTLTGLTQLTLTCRFRMINTPFLL